MNQPNSITVTCANGHQLRAPERAIGRTLPCPLCRDAVFINKPESITEPKTLLSDTGVMRILGESVPSSEVAPIPKVSSVTRDALSDTGVMRILGDFVMAPEPMIPPEQPELRSCPVCSFGVSETASVCTHCHCYVGISPDYLRKLTTETG